MKVVGKGGVYINVLNHKEASNLASISTNTLLYMSTEAEISESPYNIYGKKDMITK